MKVLQVNLSVCFWRTNTWSVCVWQPGYCSGTDCQVFPIVYGEFGSMLTAAGDLAVRWMGRARGR
jgi:hypothetical protein